MRSVPDELREIQYFLHVENGVFLYKDLTPTGSACLSNCIRLSSAVFMAGSDGPSCLSGLCCFRRGNVLHHASSVSITAV